MRHYIQVPFKGKTLLCLAFLSIFIYSPIHSNAASLSDAYSKEHRTKYKKAIKYIQAGQIKRAQTIHKELQDYPLSVYIEFQFIAANIFQAQPATIDKFINKHAQSWVAERLRSRWVRTRRTVKDYTNFIRYYDKSKDKQIELKCFFAQALYLTGAIKQAVSVSKELWLTGKSQPKACDFAFKQLKNRRLLTQSLIFKRIILAETQNNYRFSYYLQKQITSHSHKIKVNFLKKIKKNPSQLENLVSSKRLFDIDYQALIQYGMKRLSYVNERHALSLWQQLIKNKTASQKTLQNISNHVCRVDNSDLASQYCLKTAQKNIAIFSEKSIKKQIQRLLKRQQWQPVVDWIKTIPSFETNHKWLYWYVRANSQLDPSTLKQQPKNLMSPTKTSYYHVLSDLLHGKNINIKQQVRAIEGNLIPIVIKKTPISRAIELKRLGHNFHARQAWYYAMKQLSKDEMLAAAQIGQYMQWPYASITSMMVAEYWDEIHYRFPIQYLSIYQEVSFNKGLDMSWLLALSRQESNFIADIKSYSHAVGVMQLIPSTAREAAKQTKVPYKYAKLKIPNYNIQLGSHYLKKAYGALYNNPIYATAAYNAGIAKIKSWLKDSNQLPMDVWVDTLPSEDVQKYVRNVMLFSVFYADKLATVSPMLALGNKWFNSNLLCSQVTKNNFSITIPDNNTSSCGL